ncbi:MAG: DUF3006 domain-containing protein [Defluviitaleaceae bacterium]|nr:DUF3006 domain-containing protein [Defluviitaleaceae bacterium]
MAWVIDRIEEGIAVLENTETQEILELEKKDLPKGCREGHVLKKEGGCFVRDPEGDAQRKNMIQEKFNKLKFKSKK